MTGSTRSDGDSWSITESVGSTALFVAAARALETRKPDALAADQLAEHLVRAAGGEWAELLDGDGPVFPVLGQGWFGENFQRYQGSRTKFFDAVFAGAAEADVRQFVILASGLDSRAYRLAFPDGSRVFEVDQPQVLEYKAHTLSEIGVAPTAGRVTVPIDLRQDWPKALTEAGFDPTKPAAWLVEGLLIYLPAVAESALLERLAALSAPGSRVGIEHMQPIDVEAMNEGMRQLSPDAPDGPVGSFTQFTSLIYNEKRPDPVEWLAAKGWQAEGVPLLEHLDRLGHPINSPVPGQPLPSTPFSTTTLVSAALPR